MNIRFATATDWPVIEKLNELYNYHNPETFMRESMAEQRVLVSEVDGQTTGYLLWQILWGNTPFLALVKVLPEHQRQKHATALVEHFESLMQAADYKNYISSSIGTNHEAKAFHSALNYQNAGVVTMPYGEEVFYGKDL